jgi:hypothetical protein
MSEPTGSAAREATSRPPSEPANLDRAAGLAGPDPALDPAGRPPSEPAGPDPAPAAHDRPLAGAPEAGQLRISQLLDEIRRDQRWREEVEAHRGRDRRPAGAEPLVAAPAPDPILRIGVAALAMRRGGTTNAGEVPRLAVLERTTSALERSASALALEIEPLGQVRAAVAELEARLRALERSRPE